MIGMLLIGNKCIDVSMLENTSKYFNIVVSIYKYGNNIMENIINIIIACNNILILYSKDTYEILLFLRVSIHS